MPPLLSVTDVTHGAGSVTLYFTTIWVCVADTETITTGSAANDPAARLASSRNREMPPRGMQSNRNWSVLRASNFH